MAIKLNSHDQAVLKRIFGWHSAPWINAFSEVFDHLSFQPTKVLEIGASRYSAPSMFFLYKNKGTTVDVTCYSENEVQELRSFCENFCKENNLSIPSVKKYDIFLPADEMYDVILLKGVLGGLDRKHDLKVFSNAIDCCIKLLRPNGYLIIIDKGWCSIFHNFFLRNFGAAGKNNWHYFSQKELESLAGSCSSPLVVWKGFLSLGIMPFNWLQSLVDILDKYIFNKFLLYRGTVFAAVYKNDISNQSSPLDIS